MLRNIAEKITKQSDKKFLSDYPSDLHFKIMMLMKNGNETKEMGI